MATPRDTRLWNPLDTTPKPCPRCKHPMLSDVYINDGDDRRQAAHWCADCHHVIWAKKP